MPEAEPRERSDTLLRKFSSVNGVWQSDGQRLMIPAMIWQWALLFIAAFGAGVINAIAGGGTFLTFPVLLWLGFDAKIANATSTLALVPGALSSAFGYREQVTPNRALLVRLLPISLVGGFAGALLLLWTPSRFFDQVVPLLILFATLLFAFQQKLSGSSTKKINPALLYSIQFVIAVYGGYFGAGLGILLLAGLSLVGLSDIHQANGAKSFLGGCINLVAAISFTGVALVSWPEALWMALGAIIGGYGGAKIATRIDKRWIRGFVVVTGLFVSVVLLLKRQ